MPKYPFENRDAKLAMKATTQLHERAVGSIEVMGKSMFNKLKIPKDYHKTPWAEGEREKLMSVWNCLYNGNSATVSAISPNHDNWLYIIAAKDLASDQENK
jgi:hypothetical protein